MPGDAGHVEHIPVFVHVQDTVLTGFFLFQALHYISFHVKQLFFAPLF